MFHVERWLAKRLEGVLILRAPDSQNAILNMKNGACSMINVPRGTFTQKATGSAAIFLPSGLPKHGVFTGTPVVEP